MTASSLIGFAVVFLLVCWATSAALALLAARVTARGPAAERRAAVVAAVMPVALAIAVVTVLAVDSILGVDHCEAHGHHAHLCLQHGVAWGGRPWAIVTLAGAGAVVAIRAVLVFGGLVRGAWLVRRLRAVSGSRDVRLVDSERVFCFVTGLFRPTIFVSTAARAALAEDEWTAMLAHERGHITHRDLQRRLGLELLLVVAAPLAATIIRERWDAATERLRDADAADVAGTETVARALIAMARGAVRQPTRAYAAFTPAGDEILALRVTSLLDEAPRGEPVARRLGRCAVATTAAMVGLVVVFAEPLHHALETLLG